MQRVKRRENRLRDNVILIMYRETMGCCVGCVLYKEEKATNKDMPLLPFPQNIYLTQGKLSDGGRNALWPISFPGTH